MKIKSLFIYTILLVSAGLGLQGCVDGDDPNAQHNKEIGIIDSYIQNNSFDDVLYDNAYGVRFQVLSYGDNAPVRGSEVIHGLYDAWTLAEDGTTTWFDGGTIDKKLADITPPALSYLARFLFEGGSGRVFSPSRYAFGEAGDGALGVPPNSIVIYTLTITSIDRSTAYAQKVDADTTAILNYFKGHEITEYNELPSGVFYTVATEGTGGRPRPFSYISGEYEMRVLLPSGQPSEPKDQGTLTNEGIWGLIDGLKLGLPEIQKGSEVTFYIPSGLGYGDAGKGSITKDSNLIFKFKFTDIVLQ